MDCGESDQKGGRQSTDLTWLGRSVSTTKVIPTGPEHPGFPSRFSYRSNAARHGVLAGDDSGDFRILRNRGICYPKMDVACPKLKHLLNIQVLDIVPRLDQIASLRLESHLWIVESISKF